MLPFLQKTARHLVSQYPDGLDGLCIILPNRRGGLFLRKYLAAEVGKVSWAPAIFSIEDFMSQASGLQEVETLHLLFELFEAHREIEGQNAQEFDEFIRWAPQLLSDFNEVDRYLADARALFTTLTEARAITLWNPDGRPLTDFEKKYLEFYQSLHIYYENLTGRLMAKGQAYQGLVFRHAAGNTQSKRAELPWRHIIFAGFNALTKAEEQVIRSLLNDGKATMLWDADHYYLDNRQQEAGDFLREWMRKWPAKEPSWIFDDFATSVKKIGIIGSPDPVGQVKYCGHLLQELAKKGQADEKTAVVLLDEGLLIPLLNSIPGEVEAVNVTAGLPLMQTPVASLFETLFQLHLHTARFNYLTGKGIRKFYYKDVLKLLQHPYVHRLAVGRAKQNTFVFDEMTDRIRMGHLVFIGIDDIIGKNPGLFSANLSFLEIMLNHWVKPADALACFKGLIEDLRNSGVSKMELEYLFAFSRIVHQLGNLLDEFPRELKTEAFYQLYMQVVSGSTLPFYGEPLKGIQLMGMLETRSLDFENLIILSCNEDLLPSGKINSSYIPHDIKRSFGLPTYHYKDSVYAYHFYRLIQRAGNVWILYNTEPDQLGGGERSRFLRQIAHELPAYNPLISIKESILSTPPVKGEALPVIRIHKTGETLAALEQKAVKGFSATSLNAYRNCPLKFYYSEIAGIKEPEDVEDTIDPAVLGSAVHEALNNLYKSFVDQSLEQRHFTAMEAQVESAVDKAFEKKFKGSDITYGENLLLVRVAKLMVTRFLQHEAALVEEMAGSGKSMSVAFLEQFVESSVMIPFGEGELKVRLKGFIDRVDRMAGWWRIVDYKTGTTESKQVKVTDWDDLLVNPDLNIGFQLLMYSYLLAKRFQHPISASAGVVSLKRILDGFTAVSVPAEEPGKQTTVLQELSGSRFGEVIRTILKDVYDTETPFVQTDNLRICEWCPYVNLCGR